jgi:hypothetical protein
VSDSDVALFLDECVSVHIGRALRQADIDAIHAEEYNRKGKNDEQQFLFAVEERRTFVTYNKLHFAPMHLRWLEEGRDHFGILLAVDYQDRIGEGFRDIRSTLRSWIEANGGDAACLHNQLIHVATRGR